VYATLQQLISDCAAFLWTSLFKQACHKCY